MAAFLVLGSESCSSADTDLVRCVVQYSSMILVSLGASIELSRAAISDVMLHASSIGQCLELHEVCFGHAVPHAQDQSQSYDSAFGGQDEDKSTYEAYNVIKGCACGRAQGSVSKAPRCDPSMTLKAAMLSSLSLLSSFLLSQICLQARLQINPYILQRHHLLRKCLSHKHRSISKKTGLNVMYMLSGTISSMTGSHS